MAAEQTAGSAATTATEFDSNQWLDAALGRMKVTDDSAARSRGLEALNDFIKASLQSGGTVRREASALKPP